MICKISGLLVAAALAANAESTDALKLYKDAHYKAAIPALKSALAEDGKNAMLHAALLSSLAHDGRIDEAWDEAEADETAFPASADAITARGEFAFAVADMLKAHSLFWEALKLKPDHARATFGLARLLAASFAGKSARMLTLKAHALDPDDALVTKYFLGYLLPMERRRTETAEFARAHPWLYRNYEANVETGKQLENALAARRAFALDGKPSEVELHLIDIRDSPTRYRGVGLTLSINGGHKLSLLLDTGASGILLNRKAVDKAGLDHLGTTEAYGIGDDGTKKGFVATAEVCEIAPLKFKNCVFHALESSRIGKEADFDGLAGADVFYDYLISLDFQRHKMTLRPLPERPANPQGYDRKVPADEKDFTPVFRMGDHLFVITKMNDQDAGLFLLDTGASLSSVDSEFAGRSQKLHRDESMRVRGVSGEVKKVFEVDKAVIQFARYRQSNLGMTVFDLNQGPEPPAFRMSGILGLPVLALFHLTIDYRNGLVKFERAVE